MSKLFDDPAKHISTRFSAGQYRSRREAAPSVGRLSISLVSLTRPNVIFGRDPAGDRARDSLIIRATSVGIQTVALAPVGENFNDDLPTLSIDALRAALVAQLHPEDVSRSAETRDRSLGNGVEECPILVDSVRHRTPPAGEPHTRPS